MHASPSAPLRVLQVVLSLHPGGTERLVVEIVKRLRNDVPMAVCCLDEAGAWGEDLRREGVTVEALGRQPGFQPSLGCAVARLAAGHRATVLHCHHYTPFVYGVLARPWKRHLGILYTEHGRLSDAPPSRKRRTANLVLARTKCLVASVSDHLRRHMVDEGFPPDKIGVVYNGIAVGDLPTADTRQRIRRHLGLSSDDVAIGTVARLDPVKDLATMIEGVRQLGADSRVHLIVIGDGDERARLEALARGLPVRFLGHREDARELLAGCDIYANSSIHEGISLTILEAMAAALPVVATSVGGTPEIFDATCGRLVPPRDPAALTVAWRTLSSDASLRQQLGTAARKRVEARFTIERMVQQYKDTYSALVLPRQVSDSS